MKPIDLSSVMSRVFSSETGDLFGPLRPCHSVPRDLPPGWEAIAEDSCGNYFLLSDRNGVAFWDHEKGELESLASDWPTFASMCVAEPKVDSDPADVISVWIDPTFAAKHGLQIAACQRRKARK
jgi:hypothetical protein